MEIDEGGSSSPIGLAESIENELEEIIIIPENLNGLRVPEHIKWLNPAIYKPRLISIGPVFHCRSELKPMEAFKKRHAKIFIEKHGVEIQKWIDITKELEQMLREAYGMKPSEISSDKLVKIMIIDGAFLLEFLSRYEDGTFEEIDRMTHKKWNTFKCDLFLLENQIPCSYLHGLRHLTLKSKKSVSNCHCMDELLNRLLFESTRPHVFVCRLYSNRWIDTYEPKHFLDLSTRSMRYKKLERNRPKTFSSTSCPTISQLHRAGIKFCTRSRFGDAVIHFKRRTFQVPRFIINENTGRYFANFLASELYKKEDSYATDYIALMDYLIDGPEDVKILVENGILQNFLEDDKAAADLINEIGRSVDVRRDFLYSDLVEDLNAHCKKVWNKWKSTYLFEWKRDLKKNNFSNPWKTLSVIAAVLLLGLTVIQTVCSILQLNQGR